jgi:hypothetical protein
MFEPSERTGAPQRSTPSCFSVATHLPDGIAVPCIESHSRKRPSRSGSGLRARAVFVSFRRGVIKFPSISVNRRTMRHSSALPLLLFLALQAVHAQCKPGDVLIGEDADNYYCMERAKYEGSATQNFGSKFCLAKRAVAADQTAIRELGFPLDAERFEMFKNVAQEQQAVLQHKIFDGLFDQGLEATGIVLDSAKSLNPWNVNKAIDMLKAKGFDNAEVIAALRRIAQQKDKPAMVAAYRQFVQAAKSAKEGWDTASDIASDPENSQLRLMVGALKVMQGNPELGLAVTAAEFAENLTYLGYLSGQVSDLTNASDEKLALLGTPTHGGLTQRLKLHVNDMMAARNAWQKSSGYPTTAAPVCGP